MTQSTNEWSPDRSRAGRTRTVAPAASLAAAFALAAHGPAFAHFSWLSASLIDDRVELVAQFGHHLPPERTLPVERIDAVVVFDPSGEPMATVRTDQSLHAPLGEPGTYVLSARLQPRFWSRTTQGGRNASRLEHPDAFSCRASIDTVTTLVNTGGPGGVVAQAAGHDFELIARQDPSTLSAGDTLEVLVLFRGRPWQGRLQGTWQGYVPDNDDDYPLSVDTDADGIAQLVLSHSGGWLLWANTREPYIDPETCDQQAWNATLTFEVL